MSKLQIANDGAVNFCYMSTRNPRRLAQGDYVENDRWSLYLLRADDTCMTLRDLTKDEARKLGEAWCKAN